MADYGVNATQLSAPQGAGTAPVAPVQQQAVNTSMVPMLASSAGAIGEAITGFLHKQAQDNETQVVSSYTNAQAQLNDAMASGEITAAEAAGRSKALFTKYAANYAGHMKALNQARTALSGGSELGLAEEAVKTDMEIRKSAKIAAQSDGISFYSGMSKQTEDSLLAAHASEIRMNKQMEKQFKINAENRAQGSYDRELRDAQFKEQSIGLLNDLAGTNLDASRSIALDLKAQVASGKKTYEQAQLDLASHFTRINAGLTAAAGKNPDMAGSYIKLFGDLQKASESLLDPKADAARLQGQIDTLVKIQGLGALQKDPTLQRAVASAELFRASPMALQASLGMNSAVTSSVTRLITPNAPVQYPVVGNPEVEAGTLDVVKRSLNDANRDPTNVKLKEEHTAAVQNIQTQVGDMIGRGDAKSLQTAAKFFSSPEYGQWRKVNPVDAQTESNASRAFQQVYEGTMVKGIRQEIENALSQPAALPAVGVMGKSLGGQSVAVNAINPETLDVKFAGAGIVFDMKKVPTDPVEARNAKATVDSLNKAQNAANELIRLGAHLEGSVDYAKHWEQNKARYMPNVFMTPGTKTTDGQYEYVGKGDAFDFRNKANWRAISAAQ